MTIKTYQNQHGLIKFVIVSTSNGFEVIATLISKVTGNYQIRIAHSSYKTVICNAIAYFSNLISNFRKISTHK